MCSRTGAPYIAVFEDDIIIADGWLSKTLDALRKLKLRSSRPYASPWLYLRLFYTETQFMWEQEDFWYRNMPLAFGITMITSFAILNYGRWKLPEFGKHIDFLSTCVISLVVVPAFTGLLFMIGKYSLMPMKGVVEMNRHGCCTQALIFPRKQIPSLIANLEERNHGPTDWFIEEYADARNISRFAVAPPVSQHVGLHSSRGMSVVDTQSVWAFYFETNDPEDLQDEHKRMAHSHEDWTDLLAE